MACGSHREAVKTPRPWIGRARTVLIIRISSPTKAPTLRPPEKESRYKRTQIALTKKKKRREQEAELGKITEVGASNRTYGSVCPIFRTRFFFRPTSGPAGRLWPAGG